MGTIYNGLGHSLLDCHYIADGIALPAVSLHLGQDYPRQLRQSSGSLPKCFNYQPHLRCGGHNTANAYALEPANANT